MKILLIINALLIGCAIAKAPTKPERYRNEPNSVESCQNRNVMNLRKAEDKAKGITTVYGYHGLKIAEIVSGSEIRLFMQGPHAGVTHTYYSINEFLAEWPEGLRLVAYYANTREA